MTDSYHEPSVLRLTGDNETLAEAAIQSGKLGIDPARSLAFMPDSMTLEAIANGETQVEGLHLHHYDGGRVDIYALTDTSWVGDQ